MIFKILNSQYNITHRANTEQKKQKKQKTEIKEKQNKTTSTKAKNISIAGIAISAIILGGILYKKHVVKNIPEPKIDIKKLKKESEEKLRKELEELEKARQEDLKRMAENLKRERDFSSRIEKDFENIAGKTSKNKTYWEEELKKAQEEFQYWQNEFKKNNDEFWKQQDEFWKNSTKFEEKINEFWEQDAKFWENFNKKQQDFNEKFKEKMDNINSNFNYTNSTKKSSAKNKDGLTDLDIKEIDEIFKTKINKSDLENHIDTLSILLKATPEDIRKIANKDKTTYRKYVVLLHPDKNPEDKLSTFRFVILDKLYKN